MKESADQNDNLGGRSPSTRQYELQFAKQRGRCVPATTGKQALGLCVNKN
jgi:hypothetical protein